VLAAAGAEFEEAALSAGGVREEGDGDAAAGAVAAGAGVEFVTVAESAVMSAWAVNAQTPMERSAKTNFFIRAVWEEGRQFPSWIAESEQHVIRSS